MILNTCGLAECDILAKTSPLEWPLKRFNNCNTRCKCSEDFVKLICKVLQANMKGGVDRLRPYETRPRGVSSSLVPSQYAPATLLASLQHVVVKRPPVTAYIAAVGATMHTVKYIYTRPVYH